VRAADVDPTGAAAGPSTGPARRAAPADRIYPTTRVLAAGIVPFLVLGVYALYLRTGQTRRLWAWEIRSPMSALMLAAAYAGGAYYFIRAALCRYWHRIGPGLPPVTVFATLMAVVTIVHWRLFLPANIAFRLWAVLYFVTPPVIAAVWLRNRREDPGTPERYDLEMPRPIRRAAAVLGLLGLGAITVWLIAPSLLINSWAWPLTPLTGRVLCVVFALLDVYLLCLAADRRWSAARVTVESFVVATLFISVGILRTRHTFIWSRPLAWIFVVGTGGLLLIAGSAIAVIRARLDAAAREEHLRVPTTPPPR
jgi:hypothetical protein